ncbi:MAG: hypothetical protein ACM3S5_00090 [Rhodospirillales bacterium]
MRWLSASVLAAGLCIPATAANISGKWNGTVEIKTPDGGTDTGGAFAEFKQSGETISGEAGPSETHKGVIEGGKLVGNKLVFQLSLPSDSGPYAVKFNLVLVNANRLEGDFEGANGSGDKFGGKIVLDRAAP